MTREEAIKVLKHTESNIKYDANREEIYFTDKWVQAYEIAIAALREQEEGRKGCEFCTGAEKISGSFTAEGLADETHRFEVHLDGDFECCPMCGRKMEVEG